MSNLENTSTLGGTVPVVALHCSGATAGQWRHLKETLGAGYTLYAPEHYGCASAGPWTGLGRFTLADEATRTLALIEALSEPVHLVGHSYGGGLALHIALALVQERPAQIASLSLYEPSAFNLLPYFDIEGHRGHKEISALTKAVNDHIVIGDYRSAACVFVDYWGGPGAWETTPKKIKDGIIRWMPKASLDFAALINEPVSLGELAQFDVPTVLIRGAYAPAPTRVIAENLSAITGNSKLRVVDGAGHMGPLTHPVPVNELIVGHIDHCAQASRNLPSPEKIPLSMANENMRPPDMSDDLLSSYALAS